MRLIDADILLSEANDTLNDCVKFGNFGQAILVQGFINSINKLPDAEQRPHGKWIEHRQSNPIGCFYSEYECSNCHDDVWQKTEWQFCPNCGADMRVKDELNRVSKELNSEIEYKAKVKELEDAIAKCEKAEKEFKSRTCKFRSPTNCDFCSFHSDCDEHWRECEAE